MSQPIFSKFDNIMITLAGTELCGWDHHGGPNQQFRLEGQHLVTCNLNGAELVLDIQDQRAHPEEPDVEAGLRG